MRFKSSFSLYKRKSGSGKVVFYYRYYGEDGRRVCGRSTGQTTKTAAREYCIMLIKENKLVRGKYKRLLTFKEFAEGFWDDKPGGYLEHVKSRKNISKSYPDHARGTMVNHLIPKFGALKLDGITDTAVDKWLLSFPSRKLSHATGNNAFKILKIMLSWAVKEKLLEENPCKNVKLLKEKEKKRELLDHDDIKKLFGEDWKTYWGNYVYCMINKLAACTGMRIGELIGLKGVFVNDRHIIVNGQYGRYGYTEPKNHKKRVIPISQKIVDELWELKNANGDGYLFSNDGGESPVVAKTVQNSYNRALTKLGVCKEEQKRRGLSFHSWRHFLNTSLLLAKIPKPKVREVTGHLSDKETDRYTQLSESDMNEITVIQDQMLNG
jgi:integrase